MRTLKVRAHNPDITQGEVDKFITHLKLSEQHDLPIDSRIIYSKILYVDSLSTSLEAEEPSITGVILDRRMRNRQTLDTHRPVVLPDVKNPSFEVDLAYVLHRLHGDLVELEPKLLLFALGEVVHAIKDISIDIFIYGKGRVSHFNPSGVLEREEVHVNVPCK